jgi:uncharacterized OB-fold protein
MLTDLVPEIDTVNKPYWDGLAEGKLRYQSCGCGHRWLPARLCCPSCLSPDWRWVPASGRGRILSWVVYHVAYHESLMDKLPYNVAIVELEEGPRLLTNILADNDALVAEAPVQLVVDMAAPVKLPLFQPVG